MIDVHRLEGNLVSTRVTEVLVRVIVVGRCMMVVVVVVGCPCTAVVLCSEYSQEIGEEEVQTLTPRVGTFLDWRPCHDDEECKLALWQTSIDWPCHGLRNAPHYND
jgi:hypothetical protein